MKYKHTLKILVLIAVIAAASVGAYLGYRNYMGEKILRGYYIGKINVGNLSREAAIQRLSTIDADSIVLDKLAFVVDDGKGITRYEFKPSQAGAILMIDESIDDAIRLSHHDSYFNNLYFRLSKKKKTILPRFRIIDEAKLRGFMQQIASYVNCQPVPAKFVLVPASLKTAEKYGVAIKNDQIGKRMRIEETEKVLKAAIENGITEIPIIMDVEKPNLTSEMLKQIPSPSLLSSYTTYYGTHDSPNRISNIFLVASFVDNTFLSTDEVFSLLKPIGEFSGERGFKEAYVIVGDELVPQYGGGTCQIATTLYNAVMLADLDVRSRRNHGMYFSIYPLGRDATVYPPYTDFKFRNNTGHPILVEAIPTKRSLTFRIFGTPTGKTVTFTKPEMNYKYSTISTIDATGEKVSLRVRSSAFSTKVIRRVSLGGKVIKTEEIDSFYKLHGDKQKVKIRRREAR